MIETLNTIIFFFFWLILAVISHEIGHLIYMSKIYPKRNIKIKGYYNSWHDFGLMVGKQSDYDTMTTKQYFNTNFAGVSGGLLFIVFGTFILSPYVSLILLPYMFGSWHDIKEMKFVWKYKKKH